MTEKRHSRTGLLLMEIILAILFFSVAAACCLQVFAGASRLSHRAKQLKLAVNSTENLLQQLKAVEGETGLLEEFYPEAEGLEEGILCFDEEGIPCPPEEAEYSLHFQTVKKEATAEAEVVCYDKNQGEIYRVSTLLAVKKESE